MTRPVVVRKIHSKKKKKPNVNKSRNEGNKLRKNRYNTIIAKTHVKRHLIDSLATIKAKHSSLFNKYNVPMDVPCRIRGNALKFMMLGYERLIDKFLSTDLPKLDNLNSQVTLGPCKLKSAIEIFGNKYMNSESYKQLMTQIST